MKIAITGWSILIFAILLNLAASNLQLATWYTYLQRISAEGFMNANYNLRIIDALFLYIIYPVLLGFAAVIVSNNIQ